MKRTRSRSGCSTCRKRHRKCDEAKPQCQNCRLRGVECGGYDIILSDANIRNSQSGVLVWRMTTGSSDSGPRERRSHYKDYRKESNATFPHSNSQRVDHPPSQGRITFSHEEDEQAHPSSSTGELYRSDDSGSPKTIDEPVESVPCSITPPFHTNYPGDVTENFETSLDEHNFGLAVSNGSLDFLQSGFFEFPDSDFSVVQRSPPPMELLPYAGQEPKEGDELVSDTVVGIVDEMLLNFLNQPILHPQPKDPFDQYLFSHYINNLSLQLYPVKPSRNPYRLVYGYLATQSEPLRKAILFASALHLTKRGQLPNFAIRPYRAAMRDSFRVALKAEDEAWGLGATVLLSVVFDVIGTGLDAWSSKLIGCRRLLELGLANSNGQLNAGMKCIILQYNWAATMSRALLRGPDRSHILDNLQYIGQAPDFDRTTQENDLSAHQEHWWNNLPDFHMYQYLRQITELTITMDELKSTSTDMDEMLQLMPQVAELVNNLRDWKPEFSHVESAYSCTVAHFNEIWRQGMLCYVYSDIYALRTCDDRIHACVKASIDHLRFLPWLQACLFPLFLLAVHAQTVDARDCFKNALSEMHASLSFQALLSVLLVLRTIWERSDAGVEGKLDWRKVLREMNMELNILL